METGHAFLGTAAESDNYPVCLPNLFWLEFLWLRLWANPAVASPSVDTPKRWTNYGDGGNHVMHRGLDDRISNMEDREAGYMKKN